jgi:ADP-ribose pyrophosphatase YjhB (NUDIX family)
VAEVVCREGRLDPATNTAAVVMAPATRPVRDAMSQCPSVIANRFPCTIVTRHAVADSVTFSTNGANGLWPGRARAPSALGCPATCTLSAGISFMTYDVLVPPDPEAALPVKRSVALVIRDPGDPRRVLTVLRPADDEDLPNAWGLPAGSLRDGESWTEAVERAAREKLGLRVEPGVLLNEGTKDRGAYRLHMRLYEAALVDADASRSRPHVPPAPSAAAPYLDSPANPGTRYVAWKWGEAEALEPAARQGSLCCRLFLETG